MHSSVRSKRSAIAELIPRAWLIVGLLSTGNMTLPPIWWATVRKRSISCSGICAITACISGHFSGRLQVCIAESLVR
jgi:hypothetical protein